MPFWLEMVIQFAPVVVLLTLGYFVGTWRERAHFRALARREAELRDILVVNLKAVTRPETVANAEIVMSEAVIATDYFKGFVAGFRNFIGGRVTSYESLMERARREALLRLLDQTRAMGASELWNVRFETANVLKQNGGGNSPAVSVDVIASGTAITRRAG